MADTADPGPAEQNHILAFTCQAYTNTDNTPGQKWRRFVCPE